MGLKLWTLMGASLLLTSGVSAQIKVACVGNSITEGYGIWDKKKYPEHLQDMLGDQYDVKNFGHSGRMFHKASGESYWASDKFTQAYAYAPDIVVIELGTNDSKYFYDGKGSSSGFNYMYKPEYKNDLPKDYEALIDTFAHQPQAPTIYATLQPYAQNEEWGIVDTAIVNQINPIIKEVASKKGVKIIDLHSTFNKKEWLLDDIVHPNETGAKELAQIIADGILGKLSEPAENSSASLDQGSSSSSENLQESSSSSENPVKIQGLTNPTDSKIFSRGNTIFVENYIGKISVFDLNGNLIRSVQSNGFLQIPISATRRYIIKAH